MRRSVASLVVALSAALSVTSWTSATSSAATGASNAGATSAHQRALVALDRAQRVVSGRTARPEGTMALLDLRLALPRLTGADRRQALGLLARPTDHPDVNHEAYRVPAKEKCAGHICIHWVPTTRDAPPSKRWVNTMLKLMNNVWHYEVDKLGYLPPLSDGQRGGDGRYDVYLKELFDQGLYGLSVPERPSATDPRLYSGYLVIDNDFARSQFGAKPIETARVTAAHEFFHAIQFRYDVIEDHWLMESSATWMEDQFADESNDNRQYLTFGQLAHPNAPLDTFRTGGFQAYGNWPFFEYLSEHYGRGIVRSIWDQAAAFPGGGHQFSAHAVRNVLRSHGGLTAVFARYAAGNLDPARDLPGGRGVPRLGLRRRLAPLPGAPRHRVAVLHGAPPRLAERAGRPGRRPDRSRLGAAAAGRRTQPLDQPGGVRPGGTSARPDPAHAGAPGRPGRRAGDPALQSPPGALRHRHAGQRVGRLPRLLHRRRLLVRGPLGRAPPDLPGEADRVPALTRDRGRRA